METTIEKENTEGSDTIAPLNRNTVHQICSGQVISSLAIAVKELIENAIDASATKIDIHLNEYGSESVKVTDNGVGVKKENFEGLTLKHYTSKLSDFHDLETVSTLGFRGEALSSLCAVAKLSVITRHESSDHATHIQYDTNGKIVKETPAAREIGTTVTFENLFLTLPVRRKEFIKNLKREYSKMCQLLYAYCLVSTGVKFTCFNRNKMGSLNVVVATEGCTAIRNNVISIFGAKQSTPLIDIAAIEPDPEILEEFKLKTSSGDALTWEFIISNASHGNGRSAADRQFYYINARPFESQKIVKLVNNIYRQFNPTQFPFVFLNIKIARTSVDVNVTPDKRQIFIENEKFILATLKASMLKVFKNCAHSFVTQNNGVGKHGIKRTNSEDRGSFKKRIVETMPAVTEMECGDDDAADVNISKLISLANELNEKPESSDREEETHKNINDKGKNMKERKENRLNLTSWVKKVEEVKISNDKETKELIEFDDPTEDDDPRRLTLTRCVNRVEEVKISDEISEEEELPQYSKDHRPRPCTKTVEEIEISNVKEKKELIEFDDPTEENKDHPKCLKLTVHVKKIEEVKTSDDDDELITFDERPKVNKERKCIQTKTSTKLIREALELCKISRAEEERVRFRCQINPANNKTAEQELERQISKDMFEKMEIIGQFNLGFIITKLENDLFIVDQHASDEKFNFEQLQANTVLERQVLAIPKPLELTSANEELLIENIEVFRKNGFNFKIDPSAPSTKKVALSAIPMSKNCIFGKDDIDEMLYMLREDVSHAACRPTRIRGMFASRACRKSVMVGCPLKHSDMKRLVQHMGEIDQPWNCPHGRPTMRHLVNLKLLKNL